MRLAAIQSVTDTPVWEDAVGHAGPCPITRALRSSGPEGTAGGKLCHNKRVEWPLVPTGGRDCLV